MRERTYILYTSLGPVASRPGSFWAINIYQAFTTRTPLFFMALVISKLSILVQWGILLIAPTSAQSRFPSHCLVHQATDPVLSSASCKSAIDQYSNGHAATLTLFSNQPSSLNGTIQLPWDRVYNDCTLRIELIYAQKVQASISDVLTAADKLDGDCVRDSQYLGGRIFLNEQGLTLSFRPSVEVNWEERFNQSSVTVGQSTDAGSNPILKTVTASA